MVVAGIKPGKANKVKELATAMAKIFSRVEDDGVGYAAINKKGQIFGEKWLNHKDAFLIHSQPKAPNPKPEELFLNEHFSEVLKDDVLTKVSDEVVYDKFGKYDVENTVGFIMHARKKTYGEKSIVNTHPFVIVNDKHIQDFAMIHNGSISNHYNLTKKMSTCDSEVILHEYIKLNVDYIPEKISELAATLRGQYAVAMMSSTFNENKDVTPYIDIFKSNKDLFMGWVPELETVVFCTTKFALEEAIKDAGMNITNINEVLDGRLLRLNAITGARMEEVHKFTPSDQYLNSTTYPYGGRHNLPMVPAETNLVQDIDTAKKGFEENNGDLFLEPYYELADLTTEDNEMIKAIESSDNQNKIRALELVKRQFKIA